MKSKQTLSVVSQKEIAPGIYDLVAQYPEGCAPKEVRPGQFMNIYTKDASAILPRPISICGWDEDRRQIRFVFRKVGKGTGEFSRLTQGDSLDVLGPLGNGYDLSLLAGQNVVLMGGGIGAPPLLELAKRLNIANQEKGSGMVTAVLGYRTDDLFLKEEFERWSNVIIATDDGSAGVHGNVIDALKEREPACDVICACGPMPMLRGIKAAASEKGILAYISLEERMACGVGVCLGCVTRTSHKDEHSQVNNARVCTEGPVFGAEDVAI